MTTILLVLAVLVGAAVLVAVTILASTGSSSTGYQPPTEPPPFGAKVTARRSMTRESYDPSGRPMRETDEREIAYQGPAAAQVARRALALPEP